MLTAVNILGPRLVCQVESLAIVIGLVPILLVATGGWWYFDGKLFVDSWNVRHEPAIQVIPQSLVLLFWAFTGLESASIASAVVENPRRNVAIATIGGVLIAAPGVYLLVHGADGPDSGGRTWRARARRSPMRSGWCSDRWRRA